MYARTYIHTYYCILCTSILYARTYYCILYTSILYVRTYMYTYNVYIGPTYTHIHIIPHTYAHTHTCIPTYIHKPSTSTDGIRYTLMGVLYLLYILALDPHPYPHPYPHHHSHPFPWLSNETRGVGLYIYTAVLSDRDWVTGGGGGGGGIERTLPTSVLYIRCMTGRGAVLVPVTTLHSVPGPKPTYKVITTKNQEWVFLLLTRLPPSVVLNTKTTVTETCTYEPSI